MYKDTISRPIGQHFSPDPSPTFEQLAAIEPRLGALLTEARSYHHHQGEQFCELAAWYGYDGYPGFKRRLLPLVGWERMDRHPLLSTEESYGVAYQTILNALPDCRGCGCTEGQQ